ncbi:hypothetical protein HMPREF1861_00440 [Corynebacterium kroppenstedtii]|nr:hypothetical protein HMPREF1861_00440 [Corynebacterium kroppenstedtii]
MSIRGDRDGTWRYTETGTTGLNSWNTTTYHGVVGSVALISTLLNNDQLNDEMNK